MTHCICNKHTKYYNDIYEHTRNTHGQPSPHVTINFTCNSVIIFHRSFHRVVCSVEREYNTQLHDSTSVK